MYTNIYSQAMPLTERSPLQTRFLDIFLVTLFSQYDEKHIFEAFKRLVVAEDEEADRVAKEIAVYLSRLFGMPYLIDCVSSANLTVCRCA